MDKRKQFTDRTVEGLKPKATRYEVQDPTRPGLLVRVTPRGVRTFTLIARYPGASEKNRPCRRALGVYPAMSLSKARAKADSWRELIEKGIDPADVEVQQRQAEKRKRANTFAAVAEDFITDKLATERKGQEVEQDIRREFIPILGDRPITQITPLDIREIVKAIKDRGHPYQAHNILGTAKRLFGWAIDQHVYGLETSPCDRLKPKAIIGERKPRDRKLDDDEIRALWRATSRLSYPYGPAARLLLLTGQRHAEVAEAKRSEFHPEMMALIRRHADGDQPIAWSKVRQDWKLWSIGAERFKSDATHMVPLSDDVCSLLTSLPQFKKGEHLFSTTFGEKPTLLSDKIKNEIDARMLRTLKAMARKRGDDPARIELKPWIWPDLRRVVRSHLSALKVQDHVAEMVTGHGRRGIQRVYDQHRYIDEMREALTLWAARLRSIVEPQPNDNIVKLRA